MTQPLDDIPPQAATERAGGTWDLPPQLRAERAAPTRHTLICPICGGDGTTVGLRAHDACAAADAATIGTAEDAAGCRSLWARVVELLLNDLRGRNGVSLWREAHLEVASPGLLESLMEMAGLDPGVAGRVRAFGVGGRTDTVVAVEADLPAENAAGVGGDVGDLVAAAGGADVVGIGGEGHSIGVDDPGSEDI